MILVQIAVAFAAAVTLFCAIGKINRMSKRTHHGIRAAYILIAAGAFGEVAAIFSGHQPGVAESLFMSGVGLFDFMNRRAAERVPQHYDEDLPACPYH